MSLSSLVLCGSLSDSLSKTLHTNIVVNAGTVPLTYHLLIEGQSVYCMIHPTDCPKGWQVTLLPGDFRETGYFMPMTAHESTLFAALCEAYRCSVWDKKYISFSEDVKECFLEIYGEMFIDKPLIGYDLESDRYVAPLCEGWELHVENTSIPLYRLYRDGESRFSSYSHLELAEIVGKYIQK